MAAKAEDKTISLNRKAYHDYFIQDSLEAGIVLTGTEIKSVRDGRVNIRDAYARAEKGEMWLHNAHIALYDPGSYGNHDPLRSRKLLLHRKQIRELMFNAERKGFTIVPLKLYITRGVAKLELGLGRGKKQYDKRASVADEEAKREVSRALKMRLNEFRREAA